MNIVGAKDFSPFIVKMCVLNKKSLFTSKDFDKKLGIIKKQTLFLYFDT